MTLSPIILFTYNRPDHTRWTVETLARNNLASESELFIFSDAAKNETSRSAMENVRTYLRTIQGFKKVEIIERAENFGLAKSIITGVTDIVNSYGRVIVLEDDMVTSPHFLSYMNESLDLYENDDVVASIHGYIYPVKEDLPETFFLRGADCWGWATWKRAWDIFEPDGSKLLNEIENSNLSRKFDFDGSYPYTRMLKNQVEGENNSWAIRWYASAFIKNMLTLYPGRSLVENIGHDKTGVHGTQGRFYATTVSEQKILVERLAPEENTGARRSIIRYFRSIKTPIWKRGLKKLKLWL